MILKKNRSTLLKWSILSIFAILLVAEIVLRKVYGFCDAVLIKEDKDFEYIAMPNQDRVRFGHAIHYNKFSMRSPELSEADTSIILGLGDSVINGGTLTDQDSLATTILSKYLTDSLGKNTLMLNISAGSWGPDNVAAYLNKFGDFQAKLMVLVVSSHDAHDNMHFEKIVGVSPDFPDHQYSLALVELWDRYIYPRYIGNRFKQDAKNRELGIYKNDTAFNTGFDSLLAFSERKKIPFIIYLNPEISEIKKGKYNSQGLEIIDYCSKHNILLLNGLDEGFNESDHRDNIHINDKGQRKMANVLLPYILKALKTS